LENFLSRRKMLTLAAAGLTCPGDICRAWAQSVDVRGRGYDPLWRSAEESIMTFLGPGPYETDGIRIEVPDHVDSGNSVPLTVRLVSAMNPEDFPRVVHVFAHSNPNPQIVSAWFLPSGGRAAFSTRIRLERSQKITAVAQMSDGRLMRADRDVEITLGACADDSSGSRQDIDAFRPQTRVYAPQHASRGEIISVRSIISHPMETGLRLDDLDNWVSQRIISRFSCSFNGQPLFRARLYPAVSANPFFQFHAQAQSSGVLDFEWYDTQDLSFTAKAYIEVK
jgi:thiosulfate oxidation carrier complex protein SoxZ